MLCAEDRQGDGETQIAQGYDLVQAAGPCDIGLRSPQRDEEKQDAGDAHRNCRARDLKKYGENGCVHADAERKFACSIWGTFSRSIRLRIVQRRVREDIFLRSWTDARPKRGLGYFLVQLFAIRSSFQF
jgi:hypothetical protein